jgi:hypothetical protein
MVLACACFKENFSVRFEFEHANQEVHGVKISDHGILCEFAAEESLSSMSKTYSSIRSMASRMWPR